MDDHSNENFPPQKHTERTTAEHQSRLGIGDKKTTEEEIVEGLDEEKLLQALTTLGSKVENTPASIKYRNRHEITKIRLNIAKLTLMGAGILLAGCIVVSLWMPWRAEVNVYSIIISSLFGVVTLVLGFIAGSGIDRD